MSECMKMYQWLCTCLAPHSFASDMFRNLLLIMSSTWLVWKRMVISNFDVWCSMMKNTSLGIWATDTYCVITLLLSIGTGQGSTDICLLLAQVQLRYLYLLLSHHHSPTISCGLAILNTFLSTNFGAKTSEHQTSFITYTSWDLWLLDLDEQLLMANYKPCGFKGHWYLSMHVAVGRWQLAMWPRSDLIRKKYIVSIYPRCWVIDENVILLRWWPFWKWCQIGSPSQFGDCGIHFSCWYKSQWQNKTGFIRSWWVHVGSIGPMVQLMSFLLISRRVILNSELTNS